MSLLPPWVFPFSTEFPSGGLAPFKSLPLRGSVLSPYGLSLSQLPSPQGWLPSGGFSPPRVSSQWVCSLTRHPYGGVPSAGSSTHEDSPLWRSSPHQQCSPQRSVPSRVSLQGISSPSEGLSPQEVSPQSRHSPHLPQGSGRKAHDI